MTIDIELGVFIFMVLIFRAVYNAGVDITDFLEEKIKEIFFDEENNNARRKSSSKTKSK